jgi:dolichyl-phosphate-mannose-protein mannosyltransferase
LLLTWQYSQYANEAPNVGDVTPTASSQTPPKAGQDDSIVTPQPAGEQRVIGREERIEYRDQDGNLLDESQVSALESDSKVSFKTKYETRTRLVDAQGNEIPGGDGVAPNHPDVEGQNPDTKGVKEDPNSQPANAAADAGSVNKEENGKAMPASDANEATK